MIAAGSRERRHGRVVVISSITATTIIPGGAAAYSGSKAGVLHMTRVAARELVKKGVNINVICPGYVHTELTADWFGSQAGARYIERLHRKRLLDESELDGALLFLTSDASTGVTGAVITVDDGQSL